MGGGGGEGKKRQRDREKASGENEEEDDRDEVVATMGGYEDGGERIVRSLMCLFLFMEKHVKPELDQVNPQHKGHPFIRLLVILVLIVEIWYAFFILQQ
ncbi:hypothetical protein L484_027310 [Morus notabilis]|uniref:Uncharacterized protein n=1 Tax=Morus notabilis TaxID=981085 RepID=W9QK07_9ROSA|nr:hypothetical protein L484_027310 [Morus notabilis]